MVIIGSFSIPDSHFFIFPFVTKYGNGKIVFIIFIAIGPFMSLEFIFVLADIVNGCMAIPNLIGLIGLRKEIVAETEKYFEYEQPVELVTNIEG